MNQEEKEEFKQIIDAEIESLGSEIAAIKKALYPKSGDTPSDKVAHLNFKLDQSVHIQRYQEATKRLNRLKSAYLKIDSADFGICQECEEPIPIERLKLKPESIYCVTCIEELGL